jgi:hypothetical protein
VSHKRSFVRHIYCCNILYENMLSNLSQNLYQNQSIILCGWKCVLRSEELQDFYQAVDYRTENMSY